MLAAPIRGLMSRSISFFRGLILIPRQDLFSCATGMATKSPSPDFRGNPTNGWVDLTAEGKIYLVKESGRVTALLTATSRPRPGMRWIQIDDNWSLQNLVAKLCRG